MDFEARRCFAFEWPIYRLQIRVRVWGCYLQVWRHSANGPAGRQTQTPRPLEAGTSRGSVLALAPSLYLRTIVPHARPWEGQKRHNQTSTSPDVVDSTNQRPAYPTSFSSSSLQGASPLFSSPTLSFRPSCTATSPPKHHYHSVPFHSVGLARQATSISSTSTTLQPRFN